MKKFPQRGLPGQADGVIEEVLEPELPIVDPHHHLWPQDGFLPYGLSELHADAEDGHNVTHTVFVECMAAYRQDVPEGFAPVGETEWIANTAMADPQPLIAGIVAHADLRLDNLDAVLDAHHEAGRGLFRGIRHSLCRALDPAELRHPGRAPAELAYDPAFRRGVARLGERGLTYESWQYFFQAQEFRDLARAAPETTIILEHLCTPLGVGRWANRREEVFAEWKSAITDIARCPNVVVKLGATAMPDVGFGWDGADRPPTSDELIATQARYYEHVIESFGPERCMFESNFPVDRSAVSYRTLWNGFKKMTLGYSTAERDHLFRATASRIYSLQPR